MRNKKLKLKGQQYGTIQVTGNGSKSRYWKCHCCECGYEFEAVGSRLKAGKIKCRMCQQKISHGHARRGNQSSTYQSWRSMKARCKYDKNYIDVKLDPRWEIFKNFLEDMGPRPNGYSLDRANPFYGYGRRNCRWAPKDVQAGNKRGSLRIGYREVDPSTCTSYRAAVGTVAEWAWYLREATHNQNWTTKRLQEVLKVESLSDIIFAAFPFGITADGLFLMTSQEFHSLWESRLKWEYLRAAEAQIPNVVIAPLTTNQADQP